MSLTISTPVVSEESGALPSPVGVRTPDDYVPQPPRREGCHGPDPFARQRAELCAEGRAGMECRVNQHGCFYFGGGWKLCNMCEWQNGHRAGVAAGELAVFGGPIAEHAADVAAGRVVRITRTGLDELFRAPASRSFNGLVVDWHWQSLTPADGHVVLTRKQLHNLLMEYGSPSSCLTDELWLDLQARWPPVGGAAGAPGE